MKSTQDMIERAIACLDNTGKLWLRDPHRVSYFVERCAFGLYTILTTNLTEIVLDSREDVIDWINNYYCLYPITE